MKQIKKYSHFLFDFDGVIADSYELAAQKFNEIREELFPQLPEVKTKDDMATVYGGSLKTCLDKWIGQDGTKVFFNHHSKRMQDNAGKILLFHGIGEILNSLGKGNVSIVTSSYSDVVKNILARDASFGEDVIYKIAGRELNQTKTEKIINILRELGLQKEDAIYVGDLESDILYCKNVPIDIISVGYGYHPSSYLQTFSPTYFTNSINGLFSLLNQMHQ